MRVIDVNRKRERDRPKERQTDRDNETERETHAEEDTWHGVSGRIDSSPRQSMNIGKRMSPPKKHKQSGDQ